MMSNVGRTLTITFEIRDDDESKWIWESLMTREARNGIAIFAIADSAAMIDDIEANLMDM